MRVDKKPFKVVCGDCSHEWALFYTPLPLDEASRLMLQARCPSCNSKRIGICMSPKEEKTDEPT